MFLPTDWPDAPFVVVLLLSALLALQSGLRASPASPASLNRPGRRP